MIAKLSPAAQEKIRILIEAGVFPNRAAAAAFLIEEGLKLQDQLFASIQFKLAQIDDINHEMLDFIERKTSEIKQIQADLKGLVNNNSS